MGCTKDMLSNRWSKKITNMPERSVLQPASSIADLYVEYDLFRFLFLCVSEIVKPIINRSTKEEKQAL